MKTHPHNNKPDHAVEKSSSNALIPLREATKYCDYSQEYLSLRARQGKLKAVKIGRDWLTKKEWIKEYNQRVRIYTKNTKGNSQKTRKEKSPKKYKDNNSRSTNKLKAFFFRRL